MKEISSGKKQPTAKKQGMADKQGQKKGDPRKLGLVLKYSDEIYKKCRAYQKSRGSAILSTDAYR